ncbi:MAG TPA: hypothetical protein VJZ27_12355, partial [Aggregatilineales bacterium]|nr:hypothetical protein [Aggregatilineales bacterium]
MIFRFFDSISFAIERLWQHRVLVLWALIGLVAATTLALSLSLYVDSVNTGLLASRLEDPPYAYRFRYVGSWEGNITQADVTSAEAAVETGFVQNIGFPTLDDVSYVRGGTWTLRLDQTLPLGAFGLGILQGADDKIEIIAGEWHEGIEATQPDAIPVMLSENVLYTMGVEVGDVLVAQRSGGAAVNFEVMALWSPVNRNDPAWIFPP